MTTFDRAWNLVKMPVVPGSLHRAGENRWLADFFDPVSEEKLPLEVTEEEHGWKGEAEEKIGEPNRGRLFSRIGGPNDQRAYAEHDMDLDLEDTFKGKQLETDEEFRRRGYASALYDALAAILYRDYNTAHDKVYPDKRRPYTLSPEYYGLTEEGGKFWDSKDSDPWLPDNMKELWRE